MAVELGTSAGFVAAAPSDNPEGTGDTIAYMAYAQRCTAPSGNNSVTSMGWYCNTATGAANFQVGIYSHDAGNDKPNVLLASSGDVAKGTDAGWKSGAVSCALTASETYWLAMQYDDSAGNTEIDRSTVADQEWHVKITETELTDPWGTSDNSGTTLCAIYALYSAAGGVPINDPFIRPFAGPFGRAL
jgi:hypothetical protein